MSYTINKTDGTKLVVLKDGTVDISTTDLALFGKSYAGFGERLNENFVKILENFANTTAPAKKIRGQLWYDTLTNQIKVWNGNKFKPVGSSINSSSAPVNSNLGDTWFDTNNLQLYVNNGIDWTLIGPTTVAGSGNTAVVSDSIRDNVGVFKSVLKFVTNDLIVAMVSAEEFIPLTAITGFATVFKGITLSTSVSQNRFRGVATSAQNLLLADLTTVVPADNFVRADTNDSMTGTLTIFNDGGLSVGSGADLTINVSGGEDVVFQNNTLNGDILFKVNDGGVTKTVMTMDGGEGVIRDLVVKNLTVTGTETIFNTTTLAVEDNFIELNLGVSGAAFMPHYTGLKVNRGETSTATESDLYWVWDETFADDFTTTYGNSGGAWTAFRAQGNINESAPTLVDIRANIVHGRATTAQYADLAERYAADMLLEAGDVVILGGSKEITKCIKELDPQVFGVVSESPAFLMNNDAGNNDSHPMIALQGRVRVKVQGVGKKGDRIVSSDTAGVARVAALAECTAFNVLGRIIQDKYNTQIELTECVIGVK
jgi:hypothetical protein